MKKTEDYHQGNLKNYCYGYGSGNHIYGGKCTPFNTMEIRSPKGRAYPDHLIQLDITHPIYNRNGKLFNHEWEPI